MKDQSSKNKNDFQVNLPMGHVIRESGQTGRFPHQFSNPFKKESSSRKIREAMRPTVERLNIVDRLKITGEKQENLKLGEKEVYSERAHSRKISVKSSRTDFHKNHALKQVVWIDLLVNFEVFIGCMMLGFLVLMFAVRSILSDHFRGQNELR